MTFLLRLLLIAALAWALLRLLRHLIFGPSAPRQGGRADQEQRRRQTTSGSRGSESLVSCDACGLRIPQSESLGVHLPDREAHVCSDECRRRLQR
jgi:hypothetical protein